ncbi:apolipoprotein N-acyltransferase [Mycobacterium sp. 1465703.0]|uniref:apolipoprotein N-acyltransferase n=1 Tax=Mycobacterium sp. 1465703.0 TaxID=1834078 RepID=UPI0007FCAE84|nr:apolipoprotein N-acyltransferase [Mycobacterium sp. 1465703.0]
MARDRLGGEKRPDRTGAADGLGEDVPTRPDTDPISDEAESDRDDQPADIHAEHAAQHTGHDGEPDQDNEDSAKPGPTDERRPAATMLADRLGSAARGALTGLVAAVVARLPAAQAAMLPRLTRLICAVAGGLLLCASFPSLNWWWGAVLGAALLAWVLTHPATTPAGGLGYGFLFGLAFYLPLLPWVGLLVGAIPWVALATVSALFPALFGLCAVTVRRLPGWPIWFALLWAAQEWLKSAFPFGGFPWGSVAFGQTHGPFLPLVQLGGVALLSMGIMLVGFSATAIALEIVKWWHFGHAATPRATDSDATEAAPPAVVLPGVCICLVLFASLIVWPQVRHAGTGSGGDPSVTVAAVQGNVPRLGFGFNEQRRAVLDNHVQETLRLAEDVRAGAAPQPQFVIWPEDSSDIDPLVNNDAALAISQAATAIGAPILIGSVLDVPGRPPEDPRYTNTMIVWNPTTGPADRHDKEIVQPFGEYLPMPWLFKHLSGYADRAGSFVPRGGSDVVHIAGVPVGVATCWEVIFDRVPRKAVVGGAQLLAVPANNATFNKRMSEQQLAFAKVRAVEHDRYVVVAGTTGISAVIAPDGGELARTDFFQPAYLDMQVRLKTRLTPATRWGPLLQWVMVLAAGAVILAGIRHNGWFPRSIRRRSRSPGETTRQSTRVGATPGKPPPDQHDSGSTSYQGGDRTPTDDGD